MLQTVNVLHTRTGPHNPPESLALPIKPIQSTRLPSKDHGWAAANSATGRQLQAAHHSKLDGGFPRLLALGATGQCYVLVHVNNATHRHL
jgi:hypothetical protein